MLHLDAVKIDQIKNYLLSRNLIDEKDEIITVAPAGPGNMNLTLRVSLQNKNIIIKQGRPWVEKYPQFAAPIGRTQTENDFYQFVCEHPKISENMPQILDFNEDQQILVMKDLGQGQDLSLHYPNRVDFKQDDLQLLLDYLRELHRIKLSSEQKNKFQNKKMRELNHAHIFILPFQNPALLDLNQISEGLEQLAAPLRCNEQLKTKISSLGEIYLQDHDTLLHGDFYPGSWMKVKNKIYILDPEFCFCGPKEFDQGVFLAHMYLTGQKQSTCDWIESEFKTWQNINTALIRQFAGAEMLRRILGIAQLPFENNDLKFRKRLIDTALSWI